jgi:hypothetical protein
MTSLMPHQKQLVLFHHNDNTCHMNLQNTNITFASNVDDLNSTLSRSFTLDMHFKDVIWIMSGVMLRGLGY